jgi:hypothetical protein
LWVTFVVGASKGGINVWRVVKEEMERRNRDNQAQIMTPIVLDPLLLLDEEVIGTPLAENCNKTHKCHSLMRCEERRGCDTLCGGWW